MSDDIQKLPPQDIGAEKAVLGAMILDNEAIPKRKAEGLNSEDYYSPKHQCLDKAILDLFNKNEPVDIVTLADYLRKNGDLDTIGGVAYLSTLADSVPTSANIRYHARIVKEKAALRSVLTLARDIQECVSEGFSLDEILSGIRDSTKNICSGRGGDIVSMSDVAKDTLAFVEQRYATKDAISGIRTGFEDVDRLTDGWQRGDMIVVAGRPGGCKSALALTIAQNASCSCGFVSLEMTPQQLGLRTMASKSGVPIMRLRKGLLDKNHWPALIKATGTMVELPIHFSFSTRDLVQLEQVITQMVERQGIELLIVDYLQRVQNASAKTREREVAEVSSLLKTMALTHNIAVLALCQLNRAIENRNDKTPTLSDLRDSGQIEADADVIIFLHRDDPQARSGPVDLIFAKGRNIGLGKVTLHWDGDKMTFHDNKGAEK